MYIKWKKSKNYYKTELAEYSYKLNDQFFNSDLKFKIIQFEKYKWKHHFVYNNKCLNINDFQH